MDHLKTVIITSSESGVGLALTKKRLAHGERVIATVKDRVMMNKLIKSVSKYIKYENQLYVRCLDLTNLDSINIFCCEILNRFKKIDALVCNACKMISSHFKTQDGFERHMQLHFIGNLVLSIKLMPTIIKSSEPCIIQICDDTINKASIDSFETLLQTAQVPKLQYNALDSYYTSKLAQLFLAHYLQIQYPVKSYAVHPGNGASGLADSRMKLLSPIKRRYNNFLKNYIHSSQDARTVNAILSRPHKYVSGQFYHKKSLIDTTDLFTKDDYAYDIVNNFAKHLKLIT